ncbi:MAG TPA: hypothetical protein VKZ81_05400 [Pseudonocardia sp.]|jgi:hypothetical protein|uniref:hypothetical protein n=1 Tax=Pseudonocardia sp. TaxID=60912 RepID=UPI002B4B0523|nr:hypothetical protein [Pseudonocardia sp.]HLU54877.1 hypothetical protein [Pseudonocardia sp.]
MITAVLAADPGVVPPAVAFAASLTGQGRESVLVAPVTAGRPDVVVAAARIDDVEAPSPLDVGGADVDLAGVLAFAFVVGGTSGTAGWPLVAALRARGARCPAPALHVAGPPQDPTAAIGSFCRYWHPAVAGLVAARTQGSAA